MRCCIVENSARVLLFKGRLINVSSRTLRTALMNRSLAILAIFIAGVCTTAMNWRFSYQLGTTVWDSYTWAIFSVAFDVSKWLMLPFAALAWRGHKLRAVAAFVIWLVATIYSFTAAVGFAALNRDTSIAERGAQADLHRTLQAMKQSPRWQSSAGCADATAPLSKDFCTRYAAAEAKLRHGPLEADPQSALFARMTGFAPDKIRVILCVFLAIACEVISALGFFAIMPPSPKSHAKSGTTIAYWRPPTWPVTWLRRRKTNGGSAPCRDLAGHDMVGRGVSQHAATKKSPR
jgi:hypothetical protein